MQEGGIYFWGFPNSSF